MGNIVAGPFASKITDSENSGLVGHCMIDNGYYTVRIWDNCYPAQISFELFFEGDLPDIDLIVDHLCAPATPNDGLGMFNHSSSINKEIIQTNALKKFNQDESPYIVNKPLSFIDKDKTEWEVVLNKLKSPECYYCTKNPDHWIIIDQDTELHLNFISVLSCAEHKSMGRVREIVSGSGDESSDYYTSSNTKKFEMQDVFDENNKKLFTKNIEMP